MKRGGVVRELLENLIAPPATVRYPEEPLPPPKGYRGSIAILDEKCIGCSKCAIVCPTACITMVPSERPVEIKGRTIVRRKKPEVLLSSCIACGLCEEVCPTEPKAIYLTEEPMGARTKREVVVR